MNYYEILEVSQNASKEVLKAAYKSLMQRYHPDRNPGNAEAAKHSVLVTQAYEVLSDPTKRAAYDIELARQLENRNNIRDRTLNIPASVSLDDTKREPHWLLWLLVALVILSVWFVWPHSEKLTGSPELKEAGSLLRGYQSDVQQNKVNERASSIAARTIPAFIRDLDVNLESPAESTAASSVEAKYVLSIQTIGVVAGTFDPDKFISFMENNKEYIGRKLAEKLVTARYEMLIRHDGDQYLKQFILDSIGEITDTNQLEKQSSSGSKEPPAHYGAVDILLPDSFTVKTQHSDKAAVP